MYEPGAGSMGPTMGPKRVAPRSKNAFHPRGTKQEQNVNIKGTKRKQTGNSKNKQRTCSGIGNYANPIDFIDVLGTRYLEIPSRTICSMPIYRH